MYVHKHATGDGGSSRCFIFSLLLLLLSRPIYTLVLFSPHLVEGLWPQERHGQAEGVEGKLHAPRRRREVRVLVGVISPRSHRLGIRTLLGEQLQRDKQLA